MYDVDKDIRMIYLLSIFFILITIYYIPILFNSSKIRKVVIENNILTFFVGNKKKTEIYLDKIIEVKLFRYSTLRSTPSIVYLLYGFTEKNIVIKYENNNNKKKKCNYPGFRRD